MTEGVRVFVNERPVTVAPGAKVRDAVAAFDATLLDPLAAGRAYVTDGVGRPAGLDIALSAGAILRVVVSARATADQPE